MGEGIARIRAQTERISHLLYVHSAGTHAVIGSGASRNGVEVMDSKGINMRRHVAKQVSYDDVTNANLILVMEEAHRTSLFHLAPDSIDKVMLLSELSGRRYDIPDPFGGPLPDYQTAFARISGIINAGWSDIMARLELWERKKQ